MPIFENLRGKFADLWSTCTLIQDGPLYADSFTAAAFAINNKDRYLSVGQPIGVPWWFVGAIHRRESDGFESGYCWRTHLANGNPLTARTVDVPRGRPIKGNPPFTWEEAATDALVYEGFGEIEDWSVESALFHWEAYNGWGYFNRGKPSPYVWSGTNHYERGKYGSDNHYDPDLVDKEVGCAAILRCLIDAGEVTL